MWLVELKYNGKPFYGGPQESRVVCSCNTEEAAHKVGKELAFFYNFPDVGFIEMSAGVVTFSMFEYYDYAVRYHEGEWKNG